MLEILAILASPIVALVIGNIISDRKERQRRRHQLFQSLWLTRGDLGSFGRLSPEHVRALNMIEVEFSKTQIDEIFSGEAYDAVVRAWHAYRAHLNLPADPVPNYAQRDELLIDLLYEMARALRFPFTRDDVRAAYAPIRYLTGDLEAQALRDSVRAVLDGQRPIYITTDRPILTPSTTSPTPPSGEDKPTLAAATSDPTRGSS